MPRALIAVTAGPLWRSIHDTKVEILLIRTRENNLPPTLALLLPCLKSDADHEFHV